MGWTYCIGDLWRFNPSTGNWANFAPGNDPGKRRDALTWVDAAGCLWLYGGNYFFGYSYSRVAYSDLWKFDPVKVKWTLVKGYQETDSPGVFGTLGVPDPVNTPGARQKATSWTDHQGRFWLFGGGIKDQHSYFKNDDYNDLWRLTVSQNAVETQSWSHLE